MYFIEVLFKWRMYVCFMLLFFYSATLTRFELTFSHFYCNLLRISKETTKFTWKRNMCFFKRNIIDLRMYVYVLLFLFLSSNFYGFISGVVLIALHDDECAVMSTHFHVPSSTFFSRTNFLFIDSLSRLQTDNILCSVVHLVIVFLWTWTAYVGVKQVIGKVKPSNI